jgi:hypothetical protein
MTPDEPYPLLLSVVMVLDDEVPDLRGRLAHIAEEVGRQVSDFELILVENRPDNAARRALHRDLTAQGGLHNLQIYELIQPVDDDAAVWAGVENSLGDYVFVLDPLEDALGALPAALAEATRGRDVVLLVNSAPVDGGAYRRISKDLYGRLFRWLGGFDLATDAAPCRVISKRVVSYLLQYPRPAVRYRSLPATSGFSRAVLPFTARRLRVRRDGFLGDVQRGWKLLVSNTLMPLRVASTLGLFGAAMNVLYSVYVVAIALFKKNVAAGWTTLSLQQSGMFFLISLVLFMVTEYLIHALRQANDGPAYFVGGELTSAVLTRRQRLNVQSGAIAPSPE